MRETWVQIEKLWKVLQSPALAIQQKSAFLASILCYPFLYCIQSYQKLRIPTENLRFAFPTIIYTIPKQCILQL